MHRAFLLVAGLSCAACTGGAAEPAGVETTVTVAAEEALVPIDPVSEPTTIATTTTTTTPALPERIAAPNGDWDPVEIPTGDVVTPLSVGRIGTGAIGDVISPDGQYAARLDSTGAPCIRTLLDETDEVCAEGTFASVMEWLPDGSSVLFHGSDFVNSRSGPLAVLSLDGSVALLRDTENAASPIGGVESAGVAVDGTVWYSLVSYGAPPLLTVRQRDTDGSDRIVGTLVLGDAGVEFQPLKSIFDGGSLLTQIAGPFIAPSMWRFDAADDAFGPLLDEAGGGWQVPVAAVRGVLLTADESSLGGYSSPQTAGGYFRLSTVDGAASAVIDNLDQDYLVVSAALSPDGADVAVFEWYRGDDPLAEESPASGRVSIASTRSLLDGAPDWSSLPDVGPGIPLGSGEQIARSITWPLADTIHVALLDHIYEVNVGRMP